MINIKEQFINKLYYEEIEGSNFLLCPGAATRPSEAISSPDLRTLLKEQNLDFPDNLIDFYGQVGMLSIPWEIVGERVKNGHEREAMFKNHTWIKEHYFEKGYSWEAVRILLSGNLNIAGLQNIIDIEDLKATGIYQAAENVGLKGGDLRPIDFNEYAVACMKVDDCKLIDNIYLYTGFGGFPVALYDMKVSFEHYLELAYKAKCFNYWNLIYCLKDKVPNQKLMRKFFPLIFPHLTPDLEDFGIKY